METQNRRRNWPLRAGWSGAGVLSFATIWTVLAQSAPDPALTITLLNSNQVELKITNGISTTNYEIYATHYLNDPAYPWTLHMIGALGQTNFTTNMYNATVGFFQATKGDWDGDGVPNYQDTQPSSTNGGILLITIESPANGATVY